MRMSREHRAQSKVSSERGGTILLACENTSLCAPPVSALKRNGVFIPERSKAPLLSPAKEINPAAPESSVFYAMMLSAGSRKPVFPA